MKNASTCRFFFLLVVLVSNGDCCASKSQEPKEGQEPVCSEDASCVPMRECEAALHLLRLRKFTKRMKVINQKCGSDDDEQLKVCCDDDLLKYSELSDDDIFPEFCGYGFATHRIVGGEETDAGEFPWLVALLYLDTNKPKKGINLQCAGTLINPRYVITAAHCVDPIYIKPMVLKEIRIGEHNLSSSRDCNMKDSESEEELCFPEYITATAEKVIVHPLFNEAILLNDIALLRLDVTITTNRKGYITPICMPTFGSNPEFIADRYGRGPMAVGWGYTEFSKATTDTPKKVELPFFQRSTCRKRFGRNLLTAQLCAGGEKLKDSCNGDSGGPLMLIGDREVPFLQIGIVSYGTNACGIDNIPGVYTSVSHYIDWIREVTEPW